jgi:hypothetical protein
MAKDELLAVVQQEAVHLPLSSPSVGTVSFGSLAALTLCFLRDQTKLRSTVVLGLAYIFFTFAILQIVPVYIPRLLLLTWT